MDVERSPSGARFRDARFAPRRLEVERQPEGSLILTNPAPFDLRFQTTTAVLEQWAQTAPERIWLAERSGGGWRTLSFREAHEAVGVIAGGLADLGVLGPAPLLIIAHNGIDNALIAYAAMSQGMPVAPVSPQYGYRGANPTRLARALAMLRPACVYTDDAAAFEQGLSADGLKGVPVIASRTSRLGQIPYGHLLSAKAKKACAMPTDVAKYLLTSGSTGHPKAVICTHRNVSLNSAQIAACFDDPDPPVLIHSGPWSHSAGANSILHMSLHRGGTLYIDAGQPTAERFGETLNNLREVSPTFQHLVPAAWILLADELDKDTALARKFFQHMRVMQYGGASLAQAVADRIEAAAVRTIGERITFSSGYGATETGPTVCNVHWHSDRTGHVGLPLPGTSVRLAPDGEKLSFRVKGPQVAPGYLDDPDGAAFVVDDQGFYVIGDAARLVDPDAPNAGMIFDGRLAENFKLASGTFVAVGDLRLAVVDAIGGAVTDAVICGEGRDGVGVLLYPNPALARREITDAARAGIEAYNARQRGSSTRIQRALVLPDPPDAGQGEITDKRHVAQALAKAIRSEEVARLFRQPAPADVLVF